MADRMNTRFTNSACCKIIIRDVLKDVLEYISISVVNYPALDVLIHMASSNVFQLLHYVAFMCKKALNFMDAFYCYVPYKEK